MFFYNDSIVCCLKIYFTYVFDALMKIKFFYIWIEALRHFGICSEFAANELKQFTLFFAGIYVQSI